MVKYDELGIDNVELDYRELRQIVNKTHDRFSELNFDQSLSLLQKVNLLAEHFKVVLKDFQKLIDYLDKFIEEFDENLHATLEDVLKEWVENGVLGELINEELLGDINNRVTELSDDIDKHKADVQSNIEKHEADVQSNIEKHKADVQSDIEKHEADVKIELDKKRGKDDKIKRSDMDISTDNNRLGLQNLSQEVHNAMSGNAPVNPSIPINSITSDKLADGSVNPKKSVNNMKQAKLHSRSFVPLNIDTVNQVITIPSGYYLGANGFTSVAIEPQTLSYQDVQDTQIRLVYDVSEKNFKIKSLSIYHYNDNYLELGNLPNTKSLADRPTLNCDFYTVNGMLQAPPNSLSIKNIKGLGEVKFFVGGGAKPSFIKNGLNITIKFPKNYLWLYEGSGTLIKSLLTTNEEPVTLNYIEELVWDIDKNKLKVMLPSEPRDFTSVTLFINTYGECTEGHFKPYYDQQMIVEELNNNKSEGGLPAYLEDGLNKVYLKHNRVEGDFKIAITTDIHNSPSHDYPIKFTLLNEIAKRGGVNLISNLGDTSDGTYKVEQTFEELNKAQKLSNGTVDLAVLQGNHDTGFAYFYEKYNLPQPSKENSITPLDFHNYMLKNLENNFIFDDNNKYGGYYYKDYPDNKIRCIFLNSSDCYILKDGVPQINPMMTYFNEKQLKWLGEKALNFDGIENKNEYGVIIFSHASFIANSYQTINGNIAEGLLKAFVEGTSFTGEGEMLDQKFTVSSDFTSQGKMEVIGGFTGHLHCDMVKSFSFNKPLVFINCAVPIVNNTPPANSTVPQNREIGTINAECIDFVTVDRINKKLHIKRFGAGDDRTIDY